MAGAAVAPQLTREVHRRWGEYGHDIASGREPFPIEGFDGCIMRGVQTTPLWVPLVVAGLGAIGAVGTVTGVLIPNGVPSGERTGTGRGSASGNESARPERMRLGRLSIAARAMRTFTSP